MNHSLLTFKFNRHLTLPFSHAYRLSNRTLLSEAYRCEDAWAKSLESPLLRNVEPEKYFLEIDKKFNTKNLASGIDIDLFAISVKDMNQLDELEHLLYRFRRTKRANELMDSTICAVVRIFLKFKNYEALFRILTDTENYGIFPDSYLYNILLDTLIEEKMFREAAQVAILMMLQEDFSNEISRFLAVYSCHLFLKNHSLDSLFPKQESETENKQEEDDEEVLVRVPFFRNPWFDDHFDLTEPRHLIGKTFYLAGLQMKDDLLGKTFQLLGLGMYEKWETAFDLLTSLTQSDIPVLLSEGVEEFKKYMDTIPNEDKKLQFEELFRKMQESNKIESGDLDHYLNLKISEIPALEKHDIQSQKEFFVSWEQERQLAMRKQNLQLEKQSRLQAVAEKKEYLYWKEKLLFFFENEDRILEDFKKAQEVTAMIKATQKEEDTYKIPELRTEPTQKLTKYQKLIRVKKL